MSSTIATMSRLAHMKLAVPAGLLLGAAAGFFVFAMPIELIERAVVGLGLSQIVPAASPPLGGTAQFLFTGLAALTGAVLGWLALAPFDRSISTSAPDTFDFEELPALRRADAHPDAPPRRPLFAGRELGEPLELTELAPDESETEARFVEWEEPEEAAPEPTIQSNDEQPGTVSSLLARFEAGLAKRAAGHQASPAPQAAIDTTDSTESALREALDQLRRMAARR